MKKIILSFILVAAIALSFVSVYATDAKPYYTFEDGMGREEIPYGEDDNVGTVYGYTSFKMMNEEQAAAAGVPAGYSGWVLALDATANGASIGLDLTDIRVDDIEIIDNASLAMYLYTKNNGDTIKLYTYLNPQGYTINI